VHHIIKMTVGPDFMRLLDEVRAALSHSHPGASLDVLLGECMKLALATRHARARAETLRPRETASPTPRSSRYIPAPVRREVWRRDDARCTFVSDDGTRCPATRRLEIHHELALGKGGPTATSNCRLMCKGHNDLMARRDFGDSHMDRFTRPSPLTAPGRA
jgi:5-methylcytosine-specific restriction endonuclease McrA